MELLCGSAVPILGSYPEVTEDSTCREFMYPGVPAAVLAGAGDGSSPELFSTWLAGDDVV